MKKFLAIVTLLAFAGALAVAYRTIPTQNTGATHFDTILVLGSKANEDGTPSALERARVLEAVREFKAGRAEHIILSGGAAHNRWVEAEVMARVAEAAGVPAEAVEVEGHAMNTVQNIFYSHQIMERKDWRSAEVVSSPNHLPRAALILEHYSFAWRTHGAPWPPEYGPVKIAALTLYEAVRTGLTRWFGFVPTSYLPAKP